MQNEKYLLREVIKLFVQEQRLYNHCSCDTTTTQCQILSVIGDNISLTQTELCNKSGLEKSWVSRVLDGLEKDELIFRDQNSSDARMYDISFTEKGKNKYAELNKKLNEHSESIINRIPKKDQAVVIKALQVLYSVLKK